MNYNRPVAMAALRGVGCTVIPLTVPSLRWQRSVRAPFLVQFVKKSRRPFGPTQYPVHLVSLEACVVEERVEEAYTF